MMRRSLSCNLNELLFFFLNRWRMYNIQRQLVTIDDIPEEKLNNQLNRHPEA